MNHKQHHLDGRTFRSETTLFLWKETHALVVLTEVASDDLQQYRAGVRYQRVTPVVAAPCPIHLLVEYHDDDGGVPTAAAIPPPLQIQTTTSSSLRRRARSPPRVILNGSTETPPDPIIFLFANELMAFVSSCIVVSTRSGVFSGHWSRPSTMFGSIFGDLAFKKVGNYRTPRSRMSSTSLRSIPSSPLVYAALWLHLPSKFIVLRYL